jgi:F-type H+-transporting ATPase subunit a
MAHDPVEHVIDTPQTGNSWTFFDSLFGDPVAWPLPRLFDIPGYGPIYLTKFMVLELIAAAVIAAVFIPLARRAARGGLPKGAWWNAFETLLAFVRNDIAKPNLEEDTDKYVPFLWTLFLFILFCNLLGMIPLMGSPTASIFTTLGLAVFSLLLFLVAPIRKLGLFGFLGSMWPAVEIVDYPGRTTPLQDLLGLVGIKVNLQARGHSQVHGDEGHGGHDHAHDEHPAPVKEKPPAPFYVWFLWVPAQLFGMLISLMIFTIEFAGIFIRSAVLALRLFVNMFAGHVILAALMGLIVVAGAAGLTWAWGITTVISVAAVTVLSLLELFVAFMQAYVFTFLTALFLGMALHPSH